MGFIVLLEYITLFLNVYNVATRICQRKGNYLILIYGHAIWFTIDMFLHKCHTRIFTF